ncbi:MAG: hypothetical protein RIT23_1440, partial [Actinomycetota bacterium]
MTSRRGVAFLVVLGVTLAGCTMDSTPSGSAESSVAEAVDTTMAASDDTTVETTIETTTTTTTTTVPEIDFTCVTLLKCQFANLAGVDFSLLKLEFTDFSVADLTGASLVRANLKQTVLIKSSKDSQFVDPMMAQMNGEQIIKDFSASGTEQILALRLTGKFKTAF